MKAVILYAYPPEPDGLSLQGDMLYQGMKENGDKVRPCHFEGGFQKKWLYQNFKPDVAIGVGYWGHSPQIIIEPRQFGITPVPWLVADGWVADYHEEISGLPLVFVTSNWVKETYQRDGVDTKNFEISHIGIEPDLFRPMGKGDPSVRRIREMLGVKEDEKLILTVGGDVTSKGAQEVFRALKMIDKEFSNWKYLCKSWGSDCSREHHKDELELIKELGLDKKKILFLEGVFSWDFMPYLLNAADIYAAPSRLEGFGMVQVEAQACGIPVVSINVMGPKETILHGKTGYLADVDWEVKLESEIAPESTRRKEGERVFFAQPKTFAYRAKVEDIARHLLTLLTDDRKRLQMGEAAREHAVQNFHYRKIAENFTKTVKDVLALN